MKSLLVKAELRGGHVHTGWWMGDKGFTRGKCGDLVFDESEWPTIRNVLVGVNGEEFGIHAEVHEAGFRKGSEPQ